MKLSRLFAILFLVVFGLLLFPEIVVSQDENAEAEKPPKTMIRVKTVPFGASVYIDGVRADNLTPLEAEVSDGAHEITISFEGYGEEKRSVDVPKGETVGITVFLRPTLEYEEQDRIETFQGGYFLAGLLYHDLITSDIKLKGSVLVGDTSGGQEQDKITREIMFRDNEKNSSGIAISLRYIKPMKDNSFLIVDTNYLDSRMKLTNIEFPDPVGKKDDMHLYLVRTGVDLSVGPNISENVLPYLGVGAHYTVIYDEDKTGALGKDNQEGFPGYSVKAGALWNPRSRLVLNAEYRYNWSYDIEDYMFITSLGWHF
jgi:opacity protein-like surface antigen